MYTDPQTIEAKALSRILTGTSVGAFASGDNKYRLTVDPRSTAKRRRNAARYYVTKPVSYDGVTVEEQFMVSLTIDRPFTGITDADILASAKGLVAWLSASSDAALIKLIAGEN